MMDSLDYLENEEYPPDLSEERLFSLVSQIKVSIFNPRPRRPAPVPRGRS